MSDDIVETVVEDVTAFLHRVHVATEPLPPLEVRDDGWLAGDGVVLIDDVRGGVTDKQQALAAGLQHVEGVVWHYTDTRGVGAERLTRRLVDPTNKRTASWNLCIGADGTMAQAVSTLRGSWHAGGPDAALFERLDSGEWSMLSAGQRGRIRGWGANSWAFGVELENAGEVKLVDGEWLCWPFAKGTKYGAPVVVPEMEVAVDRDAHGWHKFTEAQVGAATRLLTTLVGAYGLRRPNCLWTHAAIDPKNRVDPGPLWSAYSNGVLTGLLSGIAARVFG